MASRQPCARHEDDKDTHGQVLSHAKQYVPGGPEKNHPIGASTSGFSVVAKQW